jgi:hypothetical protein
LFFLTAGMLLGSIAMRANAEALNSPWTSTTSYPKNVFSQTCVVDSGYVYCVGGYTSSSGSLTNAVYYAPLSGSGVGTWSPTTSYPTNVGGQSCIVNSGYIFCIGGDTGSSTGSIITNAVYFAPLSASGVGAWTATTTYPTEIFENSCVVDSGYVYCVGGLTNSAIINTVYFAPISASGVGTWTSTTSYPTAFIESPSCIATSAYIYCVGGYSSSGITNAVYFAPLSASGVGAWTATTTYPTNIVGQSCVVNFGYVYCVGGDEGRRILTNAVYFALLSPGGVGTWIPTTTYPTNIVGQSCVVNFGYVYCVAGITGSNNTGGSVITNAVYFVSIITHSSSVPEFDLPVVTVVTVSIMALALLRIRSVKSHNQQSA